MCECVLHAAAFKIRSDENRIHFPHVISTLLFTNYCHPFCFSCTPFCFSCGFSGFIISISFSWSISNCCFFFFFLDGFLNKYFKENVYLSEVTSWTKRIVKSTDDIKRTFRIIHHPGSILEVFCSMSLEEEETLHRQIKRRIQK